MAQNYEIDIKRFNGQDYDTLLPTPASHASTHQAGGSDPITMQTGNYANGSVTLSKIASTAFDTAPVEGSGKIITSGGVAEALANFTGGVEMVKLWENASPSSDFAAQTINVNYTGYDFIFCTGLGVNIDTWYTASSYVPVVRNNAGIIFDITADGWAHTRRFTLVNNGISFTTGWQGQMGGDKYPDWNNRAIPVAIYGIKGVT